MLNETLPDGWSAPVEIDADGSTSSSKHFVVDGCYRTVSVGPEGSLIPLAEAVEAKYAARQAKQDADADLAARVDAALTRTRDAVVTGLSLPDGADLTLLHTDGNVNLEHLMDEWKREALETS